MVYVVIIVLPTICLVAGYLYGKHRGAEENQPEFSNVDYKERWVDADALLGETGRLTDEEVKKITAEPEQTPFLKIDAEQNVTAQSQLYTLPSTERRLIAISRAEEGLPSNDNLKGMTPTDIRLVMIARAEEGME